jgi:hypothetical protein
LIQNDKDLRNLLRDKAPCSPTSPKPALYVEDARFAEVAEIALQGFCVPAEEAEPPEEKVDDSAGETYLRYSRRCLAPPEDRAILGSLEGPVLVMEARVVCRSAG